MMLFAVTMQPTRYTYHTFEKASQQPQIVQYEDMQEAESLLVEGLS